MEATDRPEWARRLVWWMASLVVDDLRDAAWAELSALEPTLPESAPVDAEQLARRLRETTTVLGGDAVLAEVRRPDWVGLAAEHGREPFGRVQRRVLVARPDCPDELTRALLAPFDPPVASRLVARGQRLPQWTVRLALARIGELRPSFLRHALTVATVDELIHATPRLDLLVRAVDGYDHNHHGVTRAFWEAVGRIVHGYAGDDTSTWLAVAAALPAYQGPLARLLHRGAAPVPAAGADLRILAQAPGPVLAEAVAALSDESLADRYALDLRPLRTRQWLTATVLDRFVEAGVPVRPLFARWAYGSLSSPATRAWAHGLDRMLDLVNLRAAEHDAALRRLLAAREPGPGPGPIEDLVAALRESTGPVEAEALLRQAPSVPWERLLDAHHTSGLPVYVLCALAAQADCPEALARLLPADRLDLVAGESPGAARVFVTALDRSRVSFGALSRIRAAATLDDNELLAVARPARYLLQYVHGVAGTPSNGLENRLAENLTAAARSAPAGFWPALLDLVPVFDGTVPELLDAAGSP